MKFDTDGDDLNPSYFISYQRK